MIEHVTLRCTDPHKSREFYVKALEPLGYEQDWKMGDSFAFVTGGHHDFWISRGRIDTPTHIAFRAKDRKSVDAFHEAALAAGGKENGKPGVRDEKAYGPNYYAAFVLDPDGHNIEAVSFEEP